MTERAPERPPAARPPPARLRATRGVKPEGQWHHGNLRESLIQWGTHLLDTQGADAMSLRAAAKLAGVSPGAPAHHFQDKNGLLAAIAAQGFRDLVALRRKRLAAAGEADPVARLRAVMLAYVDFAQAHPARFDLMYGPRIADRARYPELMAEGTASFALLRGVVVPLLPAGRGGGLSDDDLAFAVWASLHGVATLRIHGLGPPTGKRRSAEALSDVMVRFCLLAIGALAALEAGDPDINRVD